MISKTHISGQKPHERRLNKKVCGTKSAIFVRFLLGTGRMPHPVGGAMGVTCYVSEEVTNPPPSERVTNQRNPRDLRTA